MPELNFKGLADLLIGRSRDFLPSWLPGGRINGREYVCAGINGGHGDSMKVNLESGMWADFNGNLPGKNSGGDLISLYAAIEKLSQGDAFRKLSDLLGVSLDSVDISPSFEPESNITMPPKNAGKPAMTHHIYGSPVSTWCYKDELGAPIFYVARYEPTGEKKQFLPWSWNSDLAKFVSKAYPAPRPLYGLEIFAERPTDPVMIVEGEKAADAARLIAGGLYIVVAWPQGAQAVTKVDFSPLKGKKVILWPDADEPGIKAMQLIGHILKDLTTETKVIAVDGMPLKWDAADAHRQGWNWNSFYDWAVPRAGLWEPITETETETIIETEPEILTEVIHPKPQVTVSVSEDQGDLPANVNASLQEYGIATNKNGFPICNGDNVLRVLEVFPAFDNLLWYDTFHTKYFTTWKNNGTPREWTEIDELNVWLFLQRELGFQKISVDTVKNACQIYAHARPRNEPQEWLKSLTWDGTPRIEGFFSHCFGVISSEYVFSASKNFWISLVARILDPGCQVDTMVILEGGQGTFKTSALRIIGGAYHMESHYTVGTTDFYQALRGKLLIEISELESFRKAEQSTIKRMLTVRTDNYRKSYGRDSKDHPRQCIFVGTTNEREYLADNTGARRFQPMEVRKINKQAISDMRDQCYAEAVHLFKSGATWWEMPDDETKKEQESRRSHDEWEDPISEWLTDKDGTESIPVTSRLICSDVLNIPLNQVSKQVKKRIEGILTLQGWRLSSKSTDALGRNKIWQRKTT